MKRLFRDRKASIDSSKAKPTVSAPAPLGSGDTAPLYARFASVQVQRGHDHGGSAKPVVSGPMQLSAKTSFSRGSGNGTAAANGKSRGADRQSKVLSRMPSRTRQEEPPTASPPGRYSSRPQPAGVPYLAASTPQPGPGVEFPRSQVTADVVRAESSSVPQRVSAAQMQRVKTESVSSYGSESYSYTQPPRTLVVRNQDPESDSLASVASRPRALQQATSPLHPPHELEISSPFSQYARLHQSGFDLGAPDAGPRYTDPSQHAVDATSSYHNPATRLHNQISQIPHFQSEVTPVLSRQQGSSQREREDTQTSAAPGRKPSLLSTPSVTRKKYSPLAAFGFPVSQVDSDASIPTSASAASLRNYVVQTEEEPQPIAPLQQIQNVPSLPPLDVSTSSFHLPHLDIDINDWRKTASEQASRRASRISVHERANYRKSRGPPSPSPPSPVQEFTANVDEYGFSNDATVNDATVTAPSQAPARQSEEHTYPAPIPRRPVEEPGALTYRLSASLQSRHSVPRSIPSPEPIFESSTHRMPDVGETRFQRWEEEPPPVPAKPKGARPMSYKAEPEAEVVLPVHAAEQATAFPRHTPPGQQPGPVRGKPRIFAAMDATAMDEAHHIDLEPEMVELIGDVAAAAKTEEGYSAYAYGHQNAYHTPNATPPPPPPPEKDGEKERRRRKLSKPHRHRSSRKAEGGDQVSEPSRAGSSRTTHYTEHDDPRGVSQSRSPVKPVTASVKQHQQHASVIAAQEEPERRSNDNDRYGRTGASSLEQTHRSSRDGLRAPADKTEKPHSDKAYHEAFARPELQKSSSKRRAHEEQSAAYPPPPHKLSYKSTAPFIPTHPAEPINIPPPQNKRSHHPNQSSLSHGPSYRHVSSQLPTPPEEYTPGMLKKSRREKYSPPPAFEHPINTWQDASRPNNFGEPEPEGPPEPQFYPLVAHLADPFLLEQLLVYLSFYEWLILARVSKEVRRTLYDQGREPILERYLRTVGYSRWVWNSLEPLTLSVEDLCHYMRGVSIPVHQYAALAASYLQPRSSVSARTMQELTFACRAFTRVVLRLRVQAEAEAAHNTRSSSLETSGQATMHQRTRTFSSSTMAHHANKRASQSTASLTRTSSRAPSPTSSQYTHSRYPSANGVRRTPSVSACQSPLYRLRRAPLLQVFVPSPEGDWLSDTSMLECEGELKRAGVLHLLRAGDVVWDVAVGDDGNVGRMVWDGNYLIDLDYTYSRVGDAPRYLPTLAFPPSYFHRVIRTMGTGNPIVRIDVSPWADQILANIQLIQDKMRMETPQGGRHTVVRWVHRASFIIRPPPGSRSIRLPMPNTAGPGPSPTGAWVVDPSWFGTIVVETEGTNEGRAELEGRCMGPSQYRGPMTPEQEHWEERRLVFRILRERSRPGEIWIRVVDDKERIIPL